MIHIENLVKRYGDLIALDHLNLDIKEGTSGTKRLWKIHRDRLYAGAVEI